MKQKRSENTLILMECARLALKTPIKKKRKPKVLISQSDSEDEDEQAIFSEVIKKNIFYCNSTVYNDIRIVIGRLFKFLE
jgi:hypothetical protein